MTSLRAPLLLAFLAFAACETPAPVSPEADLVGLSHVGTPGHSGSIFHAPLEGAQEVPAVVTDAQGLATFRISPRGDWIDYQLRVQQIEDVLMSHIHLAPAGSNGGIVVWLYPDGPPPQLIPGRTDGMLATGRITADRLVGALAGATLEDLLDQLRSGGAYVNVHTSANPPGEIRGQVLQHAAH